MKIKINALTGAALNWAVRQAEGPNLKDYVEARDNFSTCWNKGGPIIERERISVDWMARMVWDARIYVPDEEPWQADGETMLVAAMRCYVASKLGDEVEVPNELAKEN